MGDNANPRLKSEKSLKKQSSSQEPESRYFNKDSKALTLLSKSKRASKTPVPSKLRNDKPHTEKKQNKAKNDWLSPVKIYDVKMQDREDSLNRRDSNPHSEEKIVTSKVQDVVMEDEEDNYPNSDASLNDRMNGMHIEEPKRQSDIVPMDCGLVIQQDIVAKQYGHHSDEDDDSDWVDILQNSKEDDENKENDEVNMILDKHITSLNKAHKQTLSDKKQNDNLKIGILKSSMKYNEVNNHLQTDHKSVKIVTPNRAGVLQINEYESSKENVRISNVKLFDPNEWNIKRFQIGKPLSRGKFGHVLLVREKDSKYLFVLKMMFKSQLKQNPKYLKNFRREIEIHARLNHPNIVKMHGWFHDEKKLYIIIEFCPEGELFTILHSQPNKRFPEWRASNYIKQMIQALQYLHSKKIIHRDIKPENILVDGDTLKLADFGWSIHTPNMKRKTFCGTMDYLPPEMIANKEYDYHIDVWCIGVLAYELSSGYAPFHSKNDKEVYTKIKKCEYRMFSHFSEELKDFIKRILKHDPVKRMSLDDALQHPWITKYEELTNEVKTGLEFDMET